VEQKDCPFVSIIMPIRNEAEFIERTIGSILDNDYPRDKMEILVADGCSDDGTQEIVNRIAEKDTRVKLSVNTRKIVSTGLNMALKLFRGDIFIVIGGHCEISPDFIKKSVGCLREHPEAWIVGGYLKTISAGYIGRVIAAATQSPIGVGNARHRLGGYDGWVDTVPYGAHYRWVLDKVGYFDEELVRNQDDEFNMRIISAGGKIRMSGDICSIYYSRSSLRKLWHQYFQYGFWRVRTLQKHGRPAVFRQVIPILFVLFLVILALTGLISAIFWKILAAVLVLYATGLVYGSINVGRRAGWKHALPAPLVFILLHFGYGVGALWGLIRFVILRGAGLKEPERMNLSR
jgi:succinoglycan biosynthesis protein ExoA